MNEEVKYIIEKLQELNPEAPILEGFNQSLIGYASFYADGESRFCAVYDFELMISELIQQGMTRTEAIEYYDVNIANTGGGFYPIFLYRE